MFASKQQVLAEIATVLNHDGRPWVLTIENDRVVCRWKWQDVRFFSPTSITDKERAYTFMVTLKENGKWTEFDSTEEKSMQVGAGGFSANKSFFQGSTTQKSLEIGIGKNKQTGEIGVIKSNFDTTLIKNPIREYLKQNGWKKAGLFG